MLHDLCLHFGEYAMDALQAQEKDIPKAAEKGKKGKEKDFQV